MRVLLVAMVFAKLSFAQDKTICFFSMNNEKEFKVLNSFVSKIQTDQKKIQVIEFMSQGSNPSQAFTDLVRSQTHCDGLVISGHHTGSFGGKRASGSIAVSLFEKLSCNEELAPFFFHIKALWLQGCRTLGVKNLLTLDSADYHMNRVGDVLADDGLEQSFAELNNEFSLTLDQDNPLSSRYQRVFPAAHVMGWTKTAPGEESRSENSLPYHVAHYIKKTEGIMPVNPLGTMNLSDKQKFSFYLNKMLSPLGVDQLLVNSWISQGQEKIYGFNNSDINAFKPLLYSQDGTLQMAKKIDCSLLNARNENELIQAIDIFLQHPEIYGYSFETLFTALKPHYQNALRVLQKNSSFLSFLVSKIESKQTGILRKIEYYALYRKIAQRIFPLVDQAIMKKTREYVLKADLNNYDQRDFIQSLFKSLNQNNLTSAELLQQIILDTKDSYHASTFVLDALQSSAQPIEFSKDIMLQLLNKPDLDIQVLLDATAVLKEVPNRFTDKHIIFTAIINNPSANSATHAEVIGALTAIKEPILQRFELIDFLFKTTRIDPSDKKYVLNFIQTSLVLKNSEKEALIKMYY